MFNMLLLTDLCLLMFKHLWSLKSLFTQFLFYGPHCAAPAFVLYETKRNTCFDGAFIITHLQR